MQSCALKQNFRGPFPYYYSYNQSHTTGHEQNNNTFIFRDTCTLRPLNVLSLLRNSLKVVYKTPEFHIAFKYYDYRGTHENL